MSMVLIPCKSLSTGKSRLAGELNGECREKLCEHFLKSTLSVVVDAVGAKQTKLLTSDRKAFKISAEFSVEVIEDQGSDLNSALSHVRDTLNDCDWRNCAIVPIDLPLASASSIKRILSTSSEVGVVPDFCEVGTNVLVLSREAFRKFTFRYGPDSFQRHLEVARDLGYSPSMLVESDLAFDVDDPLDYHGWYKKIIQLKACLK